MLGIGRREIINLIGDGGVADRGGRAAEGQSLAHRILSLSTAPSFNRNNSVWRVSAEYLSDRFDPRG